MEFLANTDGTQGTLQSVRWSCKPTFKIEILFQVFYRDWLGHWSL